MIAGSIAGSVERMAMFPVDTVKTHMQALRPCPLKPVGIRQAFRSIIQKEGPSALYRGIWAGSRRWTCSRRLLLLLRGIEEVFIRRESEQFRRACDLRCIRYYIK
ncbi:unnamed protein product [Arabidopsis halleri]